MCINITYLHFSFPDKNIFAILSKGKIIKAHYRYFNTSFSCFEGLRTIGLRLPLLTNLEFKPLFDQTVVPNQLGHGPMTFGQWYKEVASIAILNRYSIEVIFFWNKQFIFKYMPNSLSKIIDQSLTFCKRYLITILLKDFLDSNTVRENSQKSNLCRNAICKSTLKDYILYKWSGFLSN